jgi:hypothetical protein
VAARRRPRGTRAAGIQQRWSGSRSRAAMPAQAAADPGASRERLVSSWPPDRGPRAAPTARAMVVAPLWPRRVRDRSGANSLLDCANNERPPSKPHSPVNHAVHAGGCRRHHRLGHRGCTDRSPAAGTSTRITEMTSGSRRGASSRLPLAVRAVPRRSSRRTASAYSFHDNVAEPLDLLPPTTSPVDCWQAGQRRPSG